MTSSTCISAAVLAGGQSRRFGEDKARLPVPGASISILERTVLVLRRVADDVTIIAPLERTYPDYGARIVGEQPPGEGPLGGLLAALSIAQHERCIVVACDLPFLDSGLLAWMAALPDSADALVPVIPVDRRSARSSPQQQPLHAIYRRACLPIVREEFTAGERSLHRLLDRLDVQSITESAIRRHDPNLLSFWNVNTRADWDAAARFGSSHEGE